MSAQTILVNLLGNKCSIYSSGKDLELHHIDKNRQNNDLKNITLFCRTCHEKAHDKRAENGTPQMKLNRVGNSLKITIPVEVLRALKWQRGDTLSVDVTDSQMIVKKAKE